MKDSTITGILLLLLVAASLIAGATFGFKVGEVVSQQSAIEANVGKWIIDSKNGHKTFQYGCFIGPHLRDDETGECK